MLTAIPFAFRDMLVAGYSIQKVIVLAIILGAAWAILTLCVTLPPKARQIINIVALALLAVIAVTVLFSFL